MATLTGYCLVYLPSNVGLEWGWAVGVFSVLAQFLYLHLKHYAVRVYGVGVLWLVAKSTDTESETGVGKKTILWMACVWPLFTAALMLTITTALDSYTHTHTQAPVSPSLCAKSEKRPTPEDRRRHRTKDEGDTRQWQHQIDPQVV